MALSDLGIGLDHYDRNARLKPALLSVLPAALAIVALAPEAVLGWSGGIALVVQAGATFLLAQIVGDIGKKKEPNLFQHFGGRPTELLLCHAHAPNKVLLAERHRRLSSLLPTLRLPTAEDEQNDSKSAFEVYAACVDKLRSIARADRKKYPDVYRENVHYGFRRNLWALKPYGLTVTIVAWVVVTVDMVGRVMSHERVQLTQPVIAGALVLLGLAWTFLLTKAWVKRAATLYAERLLELLDLTT